MRPFSGTTTARLLLDVWTLQGGRRNHVGGVPHSHARCYLCFFLDAPSFPCLCVIARPDNDWYFIGPVGPAVSRGEKAKHRENCSRGRKGKMQWPMCSNLACEARAHRFDRKHRLLIEKCNPSAIYQAPP